MEKEMAELLADRPSRATVLNEREGTHGNFKVTAHVAQALKYHIRVNATKQMDPRHLEALDMIAVKIARILSGNANEHDHWKDLSGYALLGLEACE